MTHGTEEDETEEGLLVLWLAVPALAGMLVQWIVAPKPLDGGNWGVYELIGFGVAGIGWATVFLNGLIRSATRRVD